jgi:hypothetical protein
MAFQPYVLTAEDVAIFNQSIDYAVDPFTRQVTRCASFFTSYYVREPGESSGWEFDHNIDPPWQLAFHHEQRTDLVIVGGMGSAKTAGVGMSAITWATLTPNFKFLNVAPVGAQAYAMFEFLQTTLEGTYFQQRFIEKVVTKPNPKIVIHYALPNGKHVRSQLEFMSAADHAVRIKNYEADWCNLDQAEMEEDLLGAMSFLGTRVRGTIKDRTRMGRMTLLANAEDNSDLWTVFDMATDYPETNRSWLVTTRSNKNNTPEQIEGFKRRMGYDPKRIAQHLDGQRPPPRGDEFPRALIEPCVDDTLDEIMRHALEAETPGFVVESTREAKVVHWQMPPEEGASYWVVSDPGQGHPPGRNAPVVLVFDVTGYPVDPLVLRAFWWGDGGGKYTPWKNQFLLWMGEYHALAGGYDATAGQKVHSEFTFPERSDIFPIDLSGVKKNSFLNVVKLLMARQRLRFPREIPGLHHQLGKYRLPDTKLAQDLVGTLFVLAGLLWAMGLEVPPEPGHGPVEAAEESLPAVQDRYRRPAGRQVDGHRSTRRTARR